MNLRQLHFLIKEKLLLDIRSYPGCEYFELASGKFSKQFISIWELFDDRIAIEYCVKKLAEFASRITHGNNSSIIIVVGTNTEKELSKYLLCQLPEIRILNTEDYNLIEHITNFSDYSSETIFILTDVVASGSLIKKTAKLIDRLGGKAVAVLSICITDKDIIKNKTVYYESSKNELIKMEIFSVTDFAIKYHTGLDTTLSKVIKKIDPVTVLPQETLSLPYQKKPIFKFKESFEHFKTSNALSFGYFKFETHFFSTLINITNLLRDTNVANEIWKKIQSVVIEHDNIVTTYRKEDLDFLIFVQKKVQEENRKVTTIITIKRDTKDNPYFFFTILPTNKIKLRNKKVLVLLATLSSSEKLRNISSLLMSIPVKSIAILCLVNRMGTYTSSFISGIHELTKNYNKHTSPLSNVPTKFGFTPIYNFKDFDSNDLEKIQDAMEDLFRRFLLFSHITSFHILFKRYLHYFIPESKFDNLKLDTFNKYPVFIIDQAGNQNKIIIEDNIALASIINYHICSTRDYSLLKKLIKYDSFRSENIDAVLFHVVRLMVLDMSFLRSTSTINVLMSSLIEEVNRIRNERTKIERKLVSSHQLETIEDFEKYYNKEKSLLLSLAILSNFEDLGESLPKDQIAEFFLGTKAFDNYIEHPYSFKISFEENIIVFSVSLLLMGINRDSKVEGDLKEIIIQLKSNIDKITSKLHDNLKNIGSQHAKITALNKSIVSNNLNLLLKEVGLFDLRNNWQVIKYLLSKICKEASHHNESYQIFADLIFSLNNEIKGNSKSFLQLQKNTISLSKIAINNIPILQTIADLVRQFFNFHIGKFNDHEWYLATKEKFGFSKYVLDFETLIEQIHRTKTISVKEFSTLEFLFKGIFNDQLLNQESVLFKSLYSYIASPVLSLKYALNKVIREKKNDEGFKWVTALELIAKKINKISKNIILQINQYKSTADRIKRRKFLENIVKLNYTCLCDTLTLKEFFYNLLTNLRYEKVDGDNYQLNIEFDHCNEFFVATNSERGEFVRITFHLFGSHSDFDPEKFGAKISTLSHQIKKVNTLGGKVKYSNDDYKKIEVLLLSRLEYRPYEIVYSSEVDNHGEA